MPRSRGGSDTWDNVITACKVCNNKKDCCTPEQVGMPLLAIPYVPDHAQYLILANMKDTGRSDEVFKNAYSSQ